MLIVTVTIHAIQERSIQLLTEKVTHNATHLIVKIHVNSALS